MRATDRMLLRDLVRLRGQAIAIALIVTCAVASLVSLSGTHRALVRSRDAYYDAQRFGHVFASLRRAPLALADGFATLPGVEAVEARLVTDVPFALVDEDVPRTARVVSLPERGQPMQNALLLRAGRMPAPEAIDEVVVNESMALGCGLTPGASFTATLEGHRRTLRVVGVGLSPEYVYLIRPGELMPDDAHYGLFWMPRRGLASALDATGAFNDLSLRLAPGASERAVIDALDRALERYGGLGAYGREHQVSAFFLENEIAELKVSAWAFPLVFLAVASFLVRIVLARLVATQREIIATLRALGYDARAIAGHYLALVVIVVGVGAALGAALGFRLGHGLAELYTGRYFRLPRLVYSLDMVVVLAAAGASLGAGLLGAWSAVRRAIAVPPAVGMRPESPTGFRRAWFERAGITAPLALRMMLRSVARHSLRAALAATGLALGVAVLVIGAYFFDAVDVLVHRQFDEVERADATVRTTHARGEDAVRELARLPGVLGAEPLREVPVRLVSGARSHRTTIVGIAERARARRIVDMAQGALVPPSGGVTLTDRLAAILEVRPGDRVHVELLERPGRSFDARVLRCIGEYVGMTAYMRLDELAGRVDDGAVASAVHLDLDGAPRAALPRELARRPFVAGVTFRARAIAAFERELISSLKTTAATLVAFAVVIAAGVIYNAGRIALAERARDLATLRVLGLTRAEVSSMFLGELAVELGLSMPLGIATGYAVAWGTAQAMTTDLFRVPFVVSGRSVAFALGVTLVVALAVAIAFRRRIDALAMVEVLKARE